MQDMLTKSIEFVYFYRYAASATEQWWDKTLIYRYLDSRPSIIYTTALRTLVDWAPGPVASWTCLKRSCVVSEDDRRASPTTLRMPETCIRNNDTTYKTYSHERVNYVNSLAPKTCGRNFKSVCVKLILRIDISSTFRVMPFVSYAPVTSHSLAPRGFSRAIPRLFWTKIIRPFTGPERTPCNAVKIVPLRTWPIQF